MSLPLLPPAAALGVAALLAGPATATDAKPGPDSLYALEATTLQGARAPLSQYGARGVLSLFSTHPPMAERVARLEAIARDSLGHAPA